MRLRNIPGADDAIAQNTCVIKKPERYKGKWSTVFGNSNPIRLEIGMGKGRFLMKHAMKHPDVNYIGVEMYSSVLYRALERKEKEEFQGLDNIRFLCLDARYLSDVFAPNEIDRIYLNFSDPWPKARHAKRRLTSKEFLKRYEEYLRSDGILEFKTDNTALFRFSLEQVKEVGWHMHQYSFDLHNNAKMCEGNIMTEYEHKFSSKGMPINKLIASRI